MGYKSIPLDVATSVAAGEASTCESLIDKTVAISGTFTATLSIQISRDGATWADFQTGITGVSQPAFVKLDLTVPYVRINTTVWGSGVPVATLEGIEVR